MTPKFIVRHPDILTSPKELAHELGIKTRKARPGKEVRWGRDFFMHYPSANVVKGRLESYLPLWDFFSANKRDQRRALARHGLPVPAEVPNGALATHVVIRPLRHSHGHGWLVQDHRAVYNSTTHYASELFPKTNEYRLIYVLGKPIIFLRKAPTRDNLRPDEPWNHGNTTFETIPEEDWARSNLRVHTNAFTVLGECSILRDAHYVGVDILYNRRTHEWVVCEFNVCPALTIEGNRRRVAEAIGAS